MLTFKTITPHKTKQDVFENTHPCFQNISRYLTSSSTVATGERETSSSHFLTSCNSNVKICKPEVTHGVLCEFTGSFKTIFNYLVQFPVRIRCLFLFLFLSSLNDVECMCLCHWMILQEKLFLVKRNVSNLYNVYRS